MVTYLLASGLIAALATIAALVGVLFWQLKRNATASDKLLALTEASVELQIDHDDAVKAADDLEKQNKRLNNALKTAEELVIDCTDVDQLPDLLDQLQRLRSEMPEAPNQSGNGGEAMHDPAAGIA